MENFDTLLERFNEARMKVAELVNKSANKHQIMNLGLHMKSLAARLKKYGSDTKCYEFQIHVKDSVGCLGVFRMVLTGITDAERVDPIKLITYKLKVEHKDKYQLIGVAWSKELKTGVCLPA